MRSVRKRPRVSDLAGSRKSSRNAELSSLFGPRVPKVSTVTGMEGVLVAQPRTVVTFGPPSSRRIPKVSTVTAMERVLVAKPRTVLTFGPPSSRRVQNVSTVTGMERVLVVRPDVLDAVPTFYSGPYKPLAMFP